MTQPIVIALDGPAGAGKSTVGEKLAGRLGYFYFDTGVLYRAVALKALELEVDPADDSGLERLVRELDVAVRPSSRGRARQHDVMLDGRDVTDRLRCTKVNDAVSQVAASAAVRDGLIELQRRQVRGVGTVMAGRDIGTVVCPEADLKVYLVASPEERARRRLRQDGGADRQFSEVLAAIGRRDELDSTRSLAPLAKAADAIEIDTDELTVDEVVDRIVTELERRRPDLSGDAGV